MCAAARALSGSPCTPAPVRFSVPTIADISCISESFFAVKSCLHTEDWSPSLRRFVMQNAWQELYGRACRFSYGMHAAIQVHSFDLCMQLFISSSPIGRHCLACPHPFLLPAGLGTPQLCTLSSAYPLGWHVCAYTDIVPIYNLGQSAMLDFWGSCALSRRLRAVVGVFWGRWWLPVPRRCPIITVIGRPVKGDSSI